MKQSGLWNMKHVGDVTSLRNTQLGTPIQFSRTHPIGPYIRSVSTTETLPVSSICMTLSYYVSKPWIRTLDLTLPPVMSSLLYFLYEHCFTLPYLSFPVFPSVIRLFPSYSYPIFPDLCPIPPDFPYTSIIPSGLG